MEGNFLREVLREAQRTGGARNDRHLQQRIRVLEEPARDGMPRLVERDSFALLFRNDFALLLHTPDDSIDRGVKVVWVSSKMLGGASQIVSMIRVKCNGKQNPPIVTASAARRAPTMAASLQTFAMSAPLIPGESAASRCAYFCTERVDVSSCVARGRIDEQTNEEKNE